MALSLLMGTTTNRVDAEVARRVRGALTDAGVSIVELSTSSGIPLQLLDPLLAGDSPWTTHDVTTIADALSVEPAALVNDSHSPADRVAV